MDDLGLQGAPATPAVTPHHDMLASMHTQAMARYNAVMKAQTLAEEVRSELDSLVDKGEALENDDVLDAMARLVGKGADPNQFGAIIAGQGGVPPMPEGGAGLASWVQNLDIMMVQKEEALRGPLTQARLGALTSAVHLLAAHHIHSKAQGVGVSSNGKTSSGPQSGTPAGSLGELG
jgi:hypothetical protein